MLEPVEYEALRHRPDGRPAMYQQWRDLSFLHFSCAPGKIQSLLPKGLTVDTYPDDSGRERAWVGLVPFRMQGVTPAGMPPIPGCHAFPETNVRTYVHMEGGRPGVWFFSLEAANALACRVARSRFHLPYWHSKMRLNRDEGSVSYESRRDHDGACLSLQVRVGSEMECQPGSLEFFLVERYLLYAERKGTLFTGQVSHKPYSLRSLSTGNISESLMRAVGIEPQPFTHQTFSEGVDVEVFGLQLA